MMGKVAAMMFQRFRVLSKSTKRFVKTGAWFQRGGTQFIASVWRAAVPAAALALCVASPAFADDVAVFGETAFSVSPGGTIGGDRVVFGDCVLTDDCDWRGLVEKTSVCTSWIPTASSGNGILVWADTRLADLTDFRCDMDGGAISKGKNPHLNCPGFCTFNDGATAKVQFRHYDNGTMWCVKVVFTQVGGDVYGKAEYAKYANGKNNAMKPYCSESVDFDGNNKMVSGSVSVATSPTASGYGVYNLAARKWKADVKGGDIVPYPAFAPTTAAVVWKNVTLANLTDFACELGGRSILSGRDYYRDCPGFCTSNDGETAQVQFRHFENGTIWCAKVEFTQVGEDVYGQAKYGKYALNQASIESVDFDVGGNNHGIATSFSTSGYGAFNIRARDAGHADYRTTIYPDFATTTKTLYWPGASLAHLLNFSATMDGASVLHCPDRPGFCASNDGAAANVQFRYFNGVNGESGAITCVKVVFTQEVDGVCGQASYAKYATNKTSDDFNFDTGGTGYTLATSSGGTGYGALTIRGWGKTRIVDLAGNTLTLSGCETELVRGLAITNSSETAARLCFDVDGDVECIDRWKTGGNLIVVKNGAGRLASSLAGFPGGAEVNAGILDAGRDVMVSNSRKHSQTSGRVAVADGASLINLTLLDGATIDVGGRTTALDVMPALNTTNMAFAASATIAVDTGERTFARNRGAGERIVAWSAAPADVTFTPSGRYSLEAREDGLYAVPPTNGFMIIVK